VFTALGLEVTLEPYSTRANATDEMETWINPEQMTLGSGGSCGFGSWLFQRWGAGQNAQKSLDSGKVPLRFPRSVAGDQSADGIALQFVSM
jgi:hypothetical protein